MVDRIGARFPVPVEVMPFAWQMVKQQLEGLGGQGKLRQNNNGNGLAVSSHGSLILDVVFGSEQDSAEIDTLLNDMPGVVEHGIFRGLAGSVLLVVDGKLKELPSTPTTLD